MAIEINKIFTIWKFFITNNSGTFLLSRKSSFLTWTKLGVEMKPQLLTSSIVNPSWKYLVCLSIVLFHKSDIKPETPKNQNYIMQQNKN